MPRTPTTPLSPRRTLYFAYGSNLWLDQMARRCPSSYLVGRAVLPDYRWQINQRGFANVVACAGYAVHGLVFELDGDSDDGDGDGNGKEDERRLDVNEGVRTGAYEKVRLDVVLYEAAKALQMRTQTFVRTGGVELTIAAVRGRGRGASALAERAGRLERGVLVYLSRDYVREGEPRDEYIDRMNRGISDAVSLGAPAEFFRNVVRRYIPDRPPPPRPQSLRRNRSTTSTTRRGRSQTRPAGARLERTNSVSMGPVGYRDGSGAREDVGYRRRSWNPIPAEYQVQYVADLRYRPGGLEDYGSWEPVAGHFRRSRSTRRT